MSAKTSASWITPPQLAELLGTSTWWVQTQVTAKRLPHHKVGRCTKFSPADVAAIERMTAVPAADGSPPRPLARPA